MIEKPTHGEQPRRLAGEQSRAFRLGRPLKLIIVVAVVLKVAPMQPYYILMKLSGSDQLEYLLMTPFTPQKRNNMISSMAARCDFPEYGKMLFYQLPKEKLIFGPMQIEAMIDQNTLISQQLTLWDQKGRPSFVET